MKLIITLFIFYLISLKIEANVDVYSCYNSELKDKSEEITNLQVNFCDNVNQETGCGSCSGKSCEMSKGKYSRMRITFKSEQNSTTDAELDLNFIMQSGKNKVRVSMPQLNKSIINSFENKIPNEKIYAGDVYHLKYDFFIPSLMKSGNFNLTMAIMPRIDPVGRLACGVVRGSFK